MSETSHRHIARQGVTPCKTGTYHAMATHISSLTMEPHTLGSDVSRFAFGILFFARIGHCFGNLFQVPVWISRLKLYP